ncbi:SRPBCC family protein [Streptosporangium longisporum]|uniref:Carbon monoxide dehydrogenase n=1 Tax=Streptosporangium longisporum TaxID=46187 RepID=A0ABN3XUY7_9ACTN
MAMRFEHEFTVPVPVEQAWPVLLDVERVAPCLPGATVDKVEGDSFTGKLKVKVGPITVTYQGRASYEKVDEDARSMTLEASGKEARGSGTAGATVVARLHPEGRTTRVTVETSFTVTGRPAQFGRGVMAEVGGKLIDRFAANLSRLLGESPGVETAAETTPDTGGVGGWSAPSAPEAVPAEQSGETPATPGGAKGSKGSKGPKRPKGPDGAADARTAAPGPAGATAPAPGTPTPESPAAEALAAETLATETSGRQDPPTGFPGPAGATAPAAPATESTTGPGTAGATPPAPDDTGTADSGTAGSGTAGSGTGGTSTSGGGTDGQNPSETGTAGAGTAGAGTAGAGTAGAGTAGAGTAGAGTAGAGTAGAGTAGAGAAASGLGGPDGPEGMSPPAAVPATPAAPAASGPGGTGRHLSAVPTPPDVVLGEEADTRRSHPAGTSRTSLSPDEEALNLLEVAGLPLLKRVAPVVAALALLVLVAWLIRRALNRR